MPEYTDKGLPLAGILSNSRRSVLTETVGIVFQDPADTGNDATNETHANTSYGLNVRVYRRGVWRMPTEPA